MISHSLLSRAPQGSMEHVHWSSVVRVRPRTSGSITDLLLALACTQLWLVQHLREAAKWNSRRALQPSSWNSELPSGVRRPLLHCETSASVEAEISPVIGINQTNHSTDQERPCTTVPRIKKELSICPSQLGQDLVTFPVLSQIKPHTPRLVVPFRQFL